jgi:hypothetical protein
VLEDKTWDARRFGPAATVKPSTTSLQHWIHFQIPTPVILNNKRLRARVAHFRLSTIGAHVLALHVYDGENRIGVWDGLDLTSTPSNTWDWTIPGEPEIFWGMGISLAIRFENSGSSLGVVGAGIDFE